MKEHTHKYERRRLGSFKRTGHEVYKCALPGCKHYMIDNNLVVGRYSQCWGILPDLSNCPNEVEMTRYMVFSEKRKRPLCDECKEKRKQEKRDRAITEMTEEQRAELEILDRKREEAIDKLMALLEEENVEEYDEQ